MNHDGLFWVGVTEGFAWLRVCINREKIKPASCEVILLDGLTYDEAVALVLSMGCSILDDSHESWEDFYRKKGLS